MANTYIKAQATWSTVNGIVLGGDYYQITKNQNHKKGAFWNVDMIDLDKPFQLYFKFNFGNSNNGADGIAIVFQKSPSGIYAIGDDGANMGYASSGTPVLSPSIDLEFDTYDDGAWLYNDIPDDHLAINWNGSTNNVLHWASPLLPNGGNVEDNLYHIVHVTWEPTTTTMEIYYECTLIKTFVWDLKNWGFGGDNLIYYGVTAGTGSADNAHNFYDLYHTAGADLTICPGDPVTLEASSNFTTYSWSPSVGLSCTNCINPVADPSIDTKYIFTGTVGCLTITDTVDLTTYCNPLPIELVYFSAACSKQTVELDWSTASELNNDYYVLERSSDNLHFASIGTVDAAGNSSSAKNYSFIDQNPLMGGAYYRLKQVDFNGSSTFSKVQSVSCNSELGIFIYPNPSETETILQIQSSEKTNAVCEIMNVSGNVVFKKEIQLLQGSNELQIDESHFAKGIYDVSLVSRNKVVHTLLVVQ
ncbi:MAG: T9SS type A sorting domain-containing protein [Chitinophagales bacterium]|nr:T9SS type A sorting domain-containing protein [Chitinophagales bacterium]